LLAGASCWLNFENRNIKIDFISAFSVENPKDGTIVLHEIQHFKSYDLKFLISSLTVKITVDFGTYFIKSTLKTATLAIKYVFNQILGQCT
jgi:hypothetical protein